MYFLGAKTSSKEFEPSKIWVFNWIYQRKNETFFVSKSFLWQEGAMITMSFPFCSLLIVQLFLQSPVSLVRVWSSMSEITRIFHFSFVYARWWHVRAGSNCVNKFWSLILELQKLMTNEIFWTTRDFWRLGFHLKPFNILKVISNL